MWTSHGDRREREHSFLPPSLSRVLERRQLLSQIKIQRSATVVNGSR